MIELHEQNAANRFPENHLPAFKKYLDSQPTSLFVAVTSENEIVACGGVRSVGEHVNILCYGLVAPEHQRKGVGSAFTLARLAFATRNIGLHYSFIFAVSKSMGFYRRFGYIEHSTWKGEDGVAHPIGVLVYSSIVLDEVVSTLKNRSLLIDSSLPIDDSPELEAIIEDLGDGQNAVSLLGVKGVQAFGSRSAVTLWSWLGG